MPKFNLYQSLHTTVIGPEGRPLEVQIRTREMHHRAEWGVAAHWAYKEGSPSDDLAWLNRIMDWQADTNDPAQFMENLKTDLEHDEVFVFTPKGRVITLPVGATPDRLRLRRPHRGRARLHRGPGERAAGAARPRRAVGRHLRDLHVQGRRRRAQPGLAEDRPEPAGPQQDPPVVQQGAAGGRARVRPGRADRRAAPRGPARPEDPGRRRAGPGGRAPQLRRRRRHVPGRRRAPGLGPLDRAAHLPVPRAAARTTRSCPPASAPRPGCRKGNGNVGIHVEGLDDLLVRLSRCCTPVPGDEITGFVTRGRGVSVHRADCANAGRADVRPVGPPHRGRVGRQHDRRHVPGLGRGQGARSVTAAAGRVERPVRAARQHRRLLDPHRLGPGGEHALRVRDGRPQPPRRRPAHHQEHRRGLRRVPHRPGGGRN